MSERELIPFKVKLHHVDKNRYIYRIVNLSGETLYIMVKKGDGRSTPYDFRDEITLQSFEHRFYTLQSSDVRFYVIKNERRHKRS